MASNMVGNSIVTNTDNIVNDLVLNIEALVKDAEALQNRDEEDVEALQLPESQAVKHLHLLDLMYHLIVPERELPSASVRRVMASEPEDGPILLGSFPWLQPLANAVEKLKAACNLFWRKESTNLDVNITTPSVTQLHKAGIQFQPAEGSISSIRFDEENSTFYLPMIKLDVNSEAIIRNLVAYEPFIRSRRLLLTRYVDLMRGLVASAEDVKVLMDDKSGVIRTDLSDEQVAQLFNGMSERTASTHTPRLEKEIEKANAKFRSIQKQPTVVTKFVKPCLRILIVAAALALVVLAAMQVYCFFFGCSPGLLHQGGKDVENNYFTSSI